MVVFENNELEIAIVTYNRCDFVKQWLDCSYPEMVKRNISCSVYDSSTDGKTEKYICEFNEKHISQIEYIKVDPQIEIGYKPMIPILNSKSKYVWVSGDSRRHNFSELDKKVFPHIKDEMDYIQICIASNQQNDGKIYRDKSEFLRDCLISTTCIGLSIYKRSMFDNLIQNSECLAACDKDFRHNYGFGWMGYFYHVFAREDYQAIFIVVDIINILPKQKKQVWAGRFYECWVENLCDLIDKLPDVYHDKELVVRETWEKMRLDSHYYCYRARKSGGLSKEIYEKYSANGMLGQVTDRAERIRFYATAPIWLVEGRYFPVRVYLTGRAYAEKVWRRLRKMCKMI